ncbi:MAG: dTDP-4-dehydrorhamnose reductase [Verrucomicrobiota bacterium]
MMKIFILGANGQLGHDCQQVFSKYHLQCADLPELDATDKSALFGALASSKPDVVVNCAAYTAVDRCETEKEACWKVNRDVPAYLAEYCSQQSIFLVHVSTDYVFHGNKPLFEAYTESDPTDPASEYGRSKLAGELAAAGQFQHAEGYAILRTAWLYGLHGGNFLKTMLRLAREKNEAPIKVVDDQFGSPTWSSTLARQIKTMVENRSGGLYHATSEGYCSWYGLACAFLDDMDVKHSLIPCTTEEYPTLAKRPKNSIMENTHLKKLGINEFRDWREDVALYAAAIRKTEEDPK